MSDVGRQLELLLQFCQLALACCYNSTLLLPLAVSALYICDSVHSVTWADVCVK